MIGRRNAFIGLTVFAVFALLTGLMELGTITGPHVGTTHPYTAVFTGDDGVSGLRTGDAVKVSGVPVGKVVSVRLVTARRSEVQFVVNDNQPITSTTWAIVRYANLLGQRFLALTRSGGAGTPLPRGATIPDTRTAPALSLTALFNGFRPLFASLTPSEVNDISSEIVAVLQGQAGVLDSLIGHTASLTSDLADRDAVFSQVVDGLSTLLSTVQKHDDGLAAMVRTLNTLASGLRKDGPALLGALDSVDHLVGGVGNLLGQLEDHGLPETIAGVGKVAATLAQNTGILESFLIGFNDAFSTFDRLTQNGNFVNSYICNLTITTYGDVSVSGTDAYKAFLQSLGLLGSTTSGGLLGGVVNQVVGGSAALAQLGAAFALPTPLKLPNGRVGDSTAHTRVCR